MNKGQLGGEGQPGELPRREKGGDRQEVPGGSGAESDCMAGCPCRGRCSAHGALTGASWGAFSDQVGWGEREQGDFLEAAAGA